MKKYRDFAHPNGNGNGRSEKRTADRKKFGDDVKAARESAGFANCNALVKAINHKVTLSALCALEAGRASSFSVGMIFLLAEKTNRQFTIEPATTIDWNHETTLGQLFDQEVILSLVPLPKKRLT